MPSPSTLRRIGQTILASSTLVLIHSLLTWSLTAPLLPELSADYATKAEDVRSLTTIAVISILWLIFGLLEERCVADEDQAQRVITSILAEFLLLTILHIEWLCESTGIAETHTKTAVRADVILQLPSTLATFSAITAIISTVILHTALTVQILVELCFVPRAWCSADFWFANVDSYGWYGLGVEIEGGEEMRLGEKGLEKV
jgi:hypothetical protein